MPYVRSGGVSIYYEVEGSGFPVLLHAGIARGGSVWRDAGYVEGLGEYQCILLDQRGRGRSDKPRTRLEHHPDRYAADVIAVLDEIGLPQTAFFGQSAGAWVSAYLTARHPDRVAALILANELPPPEQVLAPGAREPPGRRTKVGSLLARDKQHRTERQGGDGGEL